MHIVYPHKKNSLNLCFLFLLGITVFPREIEDNGYAKFWGGKQGSLWSMWKLVVNSTIFSYLLFTLCSLPLPYFSIFFPVSICIFPSGTRVKIDSPLSYIVREDQALSNQSFFIQPSTYTQCTSVKNKQNKRFYLQCRLFLLYLDVHYNILNYTILKENKIH